MGSKSPKKEKQANVKSPIIELSSDNTVSPKTPKYNNDLINRKRRCTDILCLLLFLVFWIGMFVLAALGYERGQPQKLIYGVDWKGRTCGNKVSSVIDGVPSYDFTDYPYLFYPRLEEDLYQLELSGTNIYKSKNILSKLFGICIKNCPIVSSPDATNSTALYAHAYLDYTKNPEPINELDTKEIEDEEDISAGSPWRIMLNSSNILYRCLDVEQTTTNTSIRCIDSCTVNITTNCGTNESINPFVPCGNIGCSRYTSLYLSKCRTTQTKVDTITSAPARPNPVYDQLTASWGLIASWIGDVQKSSVAILITGGLVCIYFFVNSI